ncbi:MAG: glycosyltransferase [Cytophagales bacterium]|nr:glycosyltransferase [Cytophagales bacterium]
MVCAHDEEENLRALIPLLVSQNHPQFEVIIVEDRSNDTTYDFLYEAVQQHSNLRMVRVQHKPDHISGKKFALTLGIKAARYEHVLLTDADCRPVNANWAATMSAHYLPATDLVLGFSPYLKTKGWLNAFIRFETLLTAIQYLGFAWLGNPYMGVGRNLSYKKSMFLAGKGFVQHQHLLGGDDDLFVNAHATRKNTRATLHPDSLVYSQPATTLSGFLHQKLRHLSAGKYYRWTDKIMIGMFMLSWLSSWLLLVPAWWYEPTPYLVPVVFLVRTVLLLALVYVAGRKAHTRVELWKVPVLDIIFVFYYLVTGLRALVAKHLQWKN